MPAAVVILHLLGEIAILLWGLHMVQSGIMRAYGGDLRRFLGQGLSSRFRAVLAGVGVTALLQSSTATALMATSFAADGLVGLTPGLAVMLGANIGTALVVQVLSFDISLAAPVLLLCGVVAFRRSDRRRTRDLGRVAIGLGLMLLSLELLVATVEPVAASASLREVVRIATRDPVVAALIGAAMAWAAHSSIAAVVFVMSLAGAGLLTAEATLAMIVGANLGTAVNPVVHALGDPVALRVPLGNLFNRLVGALVVLPFAAPLAGWLAGVLGNLERLAVDGHILFNIVLAAAFLLPLPLIARAIEHLLPDRRADGDPGRPVYLDDAALATPTLALSNAARETLRMADVVETMLAGSAEAFRTGDRGVVDRISRTDDVVDNLHRSINRYLARIDGSALAPDDTRRLSEILSFAINLEHIGDIVDRNLMELAGKRIRLGSPLPAEALAAIEEMQRLLVGHLKLAVTVFLFDDAAAARRLVAAKDAFRDLERTVLRRYFRRVREGGPEGIEASRLELDILRDLKRIEAHIATTAYPLLEQTGALRPTRLAH